MGAIFLKHGGGYIFCREVLILNWRRVGVGWGLKIILACNKILPTFISFGVVRSPRFRAVIRVLKNEHPPCFYLVGFLFYICTAFILGVVLNG